MSAIQKELIDCARRTFHEIFPCSSRGSLEECFTEIGRKCVFWFNTADHSTHVMAAEMADE